MTRRSRKTKSSSRKKRVGFRRKGAKKSFSSKRYSKQGKSTGMISAPFTRCSFGTLTYAYSGLLFSGAAGTVATRYFSQNDIFDPDYTGVGGQPKYFDSMLGATGGAAPYSKFRVHASKIKLVVYPYSNNTQSDVVVSVLAQTGTTAQGPTDLEDFYTLPYIKTRNVAQVGSYKPTTLTHRCKTKWLYGVTDLDSPDFAGGYNASPGNRSLWSVNAISLDSGAVTYVNIVVVIKYYVEYFNMNKVADS